MSVDVRLKTASAWFLILWTAAVTTRYVLTVLKSLQHPYNPGDEVIFVVVWFGAAVLILCSLAIHQKAATLLWTAVIAATATAMLVKSGTWAAALIVIWIGLLVVRIGSRILR